VTDTNSTGSPDSSGREQPAPGRSKWRRPLVALLLVISLVGLGVSLLPDGIRLLTVRFLAEEGKRSAAIEKLRFNPFTGLVVIDGISVVEPDGRGVRIGRLIVDLEIASLIDRRIHFRRLRVENAALDLVRDGPQIRVSGVPEGDDSADKSPDTEEDKPWQFGVETLALRDIAVTLHDSARSEVVTIGRVDLSDLTMWDVDRETDISFAAALARGEAAFAGTIRPLAKTSLFKGKLTLGNLDLGQVVRIAYPGGEAAIRGDATLTLDLEASFGEDGQLSLSARGDVSSDRLELADGLSLSAPSLRQIDARFTQGVNGSTARLTGSATIERIAYNAGDFSLSAGGFLWDGQLEETTLKDGGRTFSAAGKLTQGKTSVGLKDGKQIGFEALRAEKLDLSGKADANSGTAVRIEGGVSVDKVSVATPEMTMSDARAAWQGTLDLKLTKDGKTGFRADGRFDTDDLNFFFPAQGIRAAQSHVRWSGTVGLDPAKGEALTHEGNIAIDDIAVDSSDPDLRVLAAGSIAVDKLVADGTGKWVADRIAIGGIRALGQPVVDAMKTAKPPPDAPVKLDAIAARSLSYDGESRLVVESVSVDGFGVDLVREKAGDFRLVGSLIALAGKTAGSPGTKAEKTAPKKSPETGDAAGAPFTFAVKDWKLGEGSRLRFVDRSVEPAVTVAIESLQGRLTGVDSARPAANVPISLSSRIGKFTAFEAEGTIRPFSESLFLDIDGSLRGFELSAIAGYARDLLGYDISRGRLDAAFKIAISDGKLEGKNALTISRLQVQPGKSKEAQAAASSLPLETALSLLRNSKDVIKLDLPVTGDVDNPEFDFSDAINQAVAGALKKAVLTTLSLTFPVGGIINAISGSNLPDKLGLKPVSFEPGSPALTANAGAFLEKVGTMLRERPDVKLTLCGIATPRDRETLQRQLEREAEDARRKALPRPATGTPAPSPPVLASPVTVDPAALLALSKQRGEAVKSRLVRQHGVKEDRLFLCAPKVDDTENATPRAEITL
tara:strand:- start:1459 stop:4494 length:3036 start_codon:yes stop_codon:yes gene_type:complete